MVRPFRRRAAIAGALVLLAAIPLSGALAQTPDYEAIVASPDRAEADRQADARRKPALLLAFTGVRPGMTVLDMETSAGYSAELLARVVGPSGKVFAQDSAAVIERFVKDNHLKVVDERSANAVLRGKITQYRNSVLLPLPLSPVSATLSAGATCKFTPRNTATVSFAER